MAEDLYTAESAVYVDKDDNVVEANDPAKVRKVVSEGGTLSHAEALKYGLVKAEGGASESVESGGANGPDAESGEVAASKSPAKKSSTKGGAKK